MICRTWARSAGRRQRVTDHLDGPATRREFLTPATLDPHELEQTVTSTQLWVTVGTQKVLTCRSPAPGAGANLGGLRREASCAWSAPHSRSRWRAPRWPWPRRPPAP